MVAAAFAGSEISGLSGAAPGASGASAATDAAMADCEVASSPRKADDLKWSGDPAAAKRQRRHETAAEAPSEGSTGAAEQNAADTRDAAEKIYPADTTQLACNKDSEPCMSTPEAPPVAVMAALPAASVASDARDSFAGNALAALAAAECATAESQPTPLLLQAEPPSQTPVADTSPQRDVTEAMDPPTGSPAAPAGGDNSSAIALASNAPDAHTADAAQTANGDTARLVPAHRKFKGLVADSAQLLASRKPWK